MGRIETEKWLKDQDTSPVSICKKLVPYFNGTSANEIYRQLQQFGMYKDPRTAWLSFNALKEKKVLEQVGRIYQRYRKKWGGPDVPLFIFPIDQGRGFFRRSDKKKSGVSFPDKIFLFLSPQCDQKEIEALFVHEYHHVCRLNKLDKDIEDYTLLDSLIIEGLAEYAVLKNCGERHLAEWCTLYSKKQLEVFWERYLHGNLKINKKERYHDTLLYGQGNVPSLLGYAVGYALVADYFERHGYTTQLSFTIPAARFLPE